MTNAYARHSYTVYAAPATEPITVDEVKSWAKIDTADDDILISMLIVGVRQAAEEYLRRSLISQTLKLTLDLEPSMLNNTLPEGVYDLPISSLYGGLPRELELPKGPVQSVTSVTSYALTNAATVYDASNYFVDTAGGRLVLNLGSIWPANMRPRAAMEVLYVVGYGDSPQSIPQGIRTGLLIHAASLYEQRGQAADALAIPPASMQLYKQFRIVGDRL